jgi:putative transposase
MDVPFLLSEAQMRRIEPFFPLSHGVPRVDDRRIVSAIIYVIKHGLMWRDAPKGYGPHKTIYNRFIRWSRLGVFNRIFAELAGKAGEPDRIMIAATHLKAHRTAASLLKGGARTLRRQLQRRHLKFTLASHRSVPPHPSAAMQLPPSPARGEGFYSPTCAQVKFNHLYMEQLALHIHQSILSHYLLHHCFFGL